MNAIDPGPTFFRNPSVTDLHWFETVIAVHAIFAAVAIFFALRVPGYTRDQRLLQCGLALLLPAFGAIAVFVMAREADAPLPKPKQSTERFDRADG